LAAKGSLPVTADYCGKAWDMLDNADASVVPSYYSYNTTTTTTTTTNNNNNKSRVIPVIIGATGTISKSFRKYVSNIPGNHEVRELQKSAILGTAHILRKVLT
jgi:hypothetical protein